jgi:hypothetical protein
MITIDGYVVDAAIVEDHTLDNEVTVHPMEKGAITTDHSRELPDEITLECVVSDHPMGPVVAARGLEVDGAAPSVDAYQRLRHIRKRGTPITITTSLGTHENMMIKQLGIPRRSTDGEALRFRVSFIKSEFVENERTTVRIAVPQQAKRVNKGSKPAKPATDVPAAAEERASILYGLIN